MRRWLSRPWFWGVMMAVVAGLASVGTVYIQEIQQFAAETSLLAYAAKLWRIPMPPTFPKLERICELLLRGTERGTLDWDETAEEGTFLVVLPTGVIQVSQINPGAPYKLEFLDLDGYPIREYLPVGEEETLAIQKVYEQASSKALQRDDQVLAIIADLEARAGSCLPSATGNTP